MLISWNQNIISLAILKPCTEIEGFLSSSRDQQAIKIQQVKFKNTDLSV